MGLTPKWWFGIFIFWLGCVILFQSASGSWISSTDTTLFNNLFKPSLSLTYGQTILNSVWTIFAWNYDILLHTGIGSIFRLFLIALSLAVLIPFLEAAIRLLNPLK
jgi:hypothetical protein